MLAGKTKMKIFQKQKKKPKAPQNLLLQKGEK